MFGEALPVFCAGFKLESCREGVEDLVFKGLGSHVGGEILEVEQRVPLAAEPLIELDHGSFCIGVMSLDLGEGLGHISGFVEAFKTKGEVDLRFPKCLSTAALGSEPAEIRVYRMQRNTQTNREGALQLAGVEAHHMRSSEIMDFSLNPVDQTGAFKDFLTEGLAGSIIAIQHDESLASVG